MTVGELYQRMDGREFLEWSVFDKIEAEDELARQKAVAATNQGK